MKISALEKFLYERRRIAGDLRIVSKQVSHGGFYDVTPMVGKIITIKDEEVFVDPSMLLSLTRRAEYVEADSELRREYDIMIEANHTGGKTVEEFIAGRRQAQSDAQEALVNYFAAEFVIWI